MSQKIEESPSQQMGDVPGDMLGGDTREKQPEMSPAADPYPTIPKAATERSLKKIEGVDAAPQKISWWLLGVIFNAVLGSFQYGYHVSVLNTSIFYITIGFEWCGAGIDTACDNAKFLQAWLGASGFIGATIGCALSTFLLAKGRRIALMGTQIIFLIGVIVTASAFEFGQLFVGRIIAGLGVGISTVSVPVYVAELVPPRNRGLFGVMHPLLIGLGIFVATALGLTQNGNTDEWPGGMIPDFEKNWFRWTNVFSGILSLVSIALFVFIYRDETPQRLMELGRSEDAKRILHKVYPNTSSQKNAYAAEESQILTEADAAFQVLEKAHDEALAAAKLREEAAAAQGSKAAASPFVCQLKSRTVQYVLFIGVAMAALQQLGGINVFLASSTAFYTQAGVSQNTAQILSTLSNLLIMIMCASSGLYVDRLGRKTMMMLGISVQILAIGLTAILFLVRSPDSLVDGWQWVPIVCVFVFLAAFAAANGPLLWVFLSEIYPADIRGPCLSSAAVINWACAALIVFGASLLSIRVSFVIFTVCTILQLLLVIFGMLETAGRNLEDSPYFANEKKAKGEGTPKTPQAVEIA